MITYNDNKITITHSVSDVMSSAQYQMSLFARTLVDKDGLDHAENYTIKESDKPAVLIALQEVCTDLREVLLILTADVSEAIKIDNDNIVVTINKYNNNTKLVKQLDDIVSNLLSIGILQSWAKKTNLPDKSDRYAALYSANMTLLGSVALRLAEVSTSDNLFN